MFDQEKYNSIVMDNYTRIYRYCLSRLSYIKQDAEEATEDTMITLFLKLDTLDVEDNIAAWLFRAADNHIKRIIKKRTSEKSLDEFGENNNTGGNQEESEEIRKLIEDITYKQKLDEILNNLPPDLRELFALRFIQHLSLQEIEKKTGIPISTAWLRIEKIKKLIYNSNSLINPENQAENRRLLYGTKKVTNSEGGKRNE